MSWRESIVTHEYVAHGASCMYCACTLVAGVSADEAETAAREHAEIHQAHYSHTEDTRLPEHLRPIDVLRALDYRIEITYVATGGASFDVHVRRTSDNVVSTTRVRLEGGAKPMIVDAFVEAIRVALAHA